MPTRNRPTLLTHSFIAVAMIGGMSACGDDQEPAAAADPTPSATLLINQEADGYFRARLNGTTAVNDQGCIVIDDYLLVAPDGSRLDDDGTTVHLTGYEPFQVGDDIQLGGGYEELPRTEAPADIQACSPAEADPVKVAAVAPNEPNNS